MGCSFCAFYTLRRTHSQQNRMKKKLDSHYYVPPLGRSRVQYLRLALTDIFAMLPPSEVTEVTVLHAYLCV